MNNIDRIRKGAEPGAQAEDRGPCGDDHRGGALPAGASPRHKLTQKKMAEALGIGQDSVSRLEQRSDLLISTLRDYVEAMGGKALARGGVPGPGAGDPHRARGPGLSRSSVGACSSTEVEVHRS